MVGEGRESKKDNDLLFTCGLIEYRLLGVREILRLFKMSDERFENLELYPDVPKPCFDFLPQKLYNI